MRYEKLNLQVAEELHIAVLGRLIVIERAAAYRFRHLPDAFLYRPPGSLVQAVADLGEADPVVARVPVPSQFDRLGAGHQALNEFPGLAERVVLLI